MQHWVCASDSHVSACGLSSQHLSTFQSCKARKPSRKGVSCQATRQKKKVSKSRAKDKADVPRSKEGRGFTSGSEQDINPTVNTASANSQPAELDDNLQPAQINQTNQKPLPKVARSRVFWVCLQTSSGLAGAALLLRKFGAMPASTFLDTYTPTTQALLTGVQFGKASHWGLAVATAVGVTAARQALITLWPSYRDASDRSNEQMMRSLRWYDLLWLGVLPGISEELLFRGAVLPAIAADWRGALIAGVAFGSLHITGGRNWAFAAFASAVGAAYGFSYLATENVVVPMAAHVLSNILAAALYKQLRQPLKPT